MRISGHFIPLCRYPPIVMEDFRNAILSISLIDKSSKKDLYKVYNLLALHPELKVQFYYILEVEYFAIFISGTCAAIPTSHEIHIYLASQGHPCVPNTVLYPVDKIEWYAYALFIRNHDLVREHCLVDSCTWHANLAFNLDGYIWVVNALASERIQVCCLEETHLESIIPP